MAGTRQNLPKMIDLLEYGLVSEGDRYQFSLDTKFEYVATICASGEVSCPKVENGKPLSVSAFCNLILKNLSPNSKSSTYSGLRCGLIGENRIQCKKLQLEAIKMGWKPKKQNQNSSNKRKIEEQEHGDEKPKLENEIEEYLDLNEPAIDNNEWKELYLQGEERNRTLRSENENLKMEVQQLNLRVSNLEEQLKHALKKIRIASEALM